MIGFRKTEIIVITISILLFLPICAFAAPLEDIEGHWAEKQIEIWLENELLLGYLDATFHPDQPITRAEFVTIINRIFGIKAEDGEVTFSDVPKGSIYFAEVAAAVKAGYISGYPDGTFRPDQLITREEAAVIITRILGLKGGEELKFTDNHEIAPWAKEAVKALFASGIVIGYPDGTFRPKNPLTRAEMVVILLRVIEFRERLEETGKQDEEEEKEDATSSQRILVTAVRVSGTPVVGESLEAVDLRPANATVTYQWQKSATRDGEYADIDNANEKTYKLIEDDRDMWVRVKVTGTGKYRGTIISEPFGPIIGKGSIRVNKDLANPSAVGLWDLFSVSTAPSEGITDDKLVMWKIELLEGEGYGDINGLKLEWLTPNKNNDYIPHELTFEDNVAYSGIFPWVGHRLDFFRVTWLKEGTYRFRISVVDIETKYELAFDEIEVAVVNLMDTENNPIALEHVKYEVRYTSDDFMYPDEEIFHEGKLEIKAEQNEEFGYWVRVELNEEVDHIDGVQYIIEIAKADQSEINEKDVTLKYVTKYYGFFFTVSIPVYGENGRLKGVFPSNSFTLFDEPEDLLPDNSGVSTHTMSPFKVRFNKQGIYNVTIYGVQIPADSILQWSKNN